MPESCTQVVLRIIDAVLCLGLSALFAVSIVLLKRIERAVLYGSSSHLDSSQVTELAKETLAGITDIDPLMREAGSLMTWPELLSAKIQEEYHCALQCAEKCYARSILHQVYLSVTGPPALLRGQV